MDKINAVITGVGGYVPEDVLTNEDIQEYQDLILPFLLM